MRFPLGATLKIAGHIAANRLRGRERFATVLQLEPLHTCNLSCTGCGRIREYSTSLADRMSLEDCLAAAAECGAPMVSICGGEPLLHPDIERLVIGLLAQGRIVYICTNGVAMRRKLRDLLATELAARPIATKTRLVTLQSDGLLSDAQADAIRQARPDPDRPVIRPSSRLYWNIHLDGLEHTHDAVVEREGVFREGIAAIRMAKALGFQVATNTTVYRETKMQEIEELFRLLGRLGVDGHTLSPGYDYDAAKQDMVGRLGLDPANFFLTRAATVDKFRDAVRWGREYPILGTPIYLEFLAGLRDLSCSAWAIPTRNIRGWRAPCYLIADTHHPSYRDLLERTDWARYGVVDGTARDPRCANCMTHCGYEPTASLGIGGRRGDTWKNLAFQFGPRPRPRPARATDGG